MTYIQCHFCKSMVDADIFLLQMCATHLHPKFFLEIVLDRFKIKDWLSLSPDANHLPTRVYRDQEQRIQMIESALFFLVTILSNRQVPIIQIFLVTKRRRYSYMISASMMFAKYVKVDSLEVLTIFQVC